MCLKIGNAFHNDKCLILHTKMEIICSKFWRFISKKGIWPGRKRVHTQRAKAKEIARFHTITLPHIHLKYNYINYIYYIINHNNNPNSIVSKYLPLLNTAISCTGILIIIPAWKVYWANMILNWKPYLQLTTYFYKSRMATRS